MRETRMAINLNHRPIVFIEWSPAYGTYQVKRKTKKGGEITVHITGGWNHSTNFDFLLKEALAHAKERNFIFHLDWYNTLKTRLLLGIEVTNYEFRAGKSKELQRKIRKLWETGSSVRDIANNSSDNQTILRINGVQQD